MKNIKNTLQKFLLGVGILLLSGMVAHAGFGISPSDINHEYLKPGSSFTTDFLLSRSGSLSEMDIVVEPDLGAINSWFTFKPGKVFRFAQGQRTMPFQVVVNVPETAEYKEYGGSLRLKAVPVDQSVKGVTVAQGLKVNAGLTLTEEDIEKLTITAIKVEDVVKSNPVKVDVVGRNEGNVESSPIAKVKIMDLQMNLLEEHEISSLGSVKPNETKTLTGQFLTNLDLGEYFIEVDVLLGDQSLRKEKLVFKIVKEAPAVADSTKKDSTSSLLPIVTFLQNNQKYVLWVVVAIIAAIIIYLLIDRLWKDKPVEEKEKVAAVALGSKSSTRQVLSIAFGFLVFLGLFSAALSEIEVKETVVNDSKKEVQGAVDSTVKSEPMLNVLPSPASDVSYPVYSQPNTSSSVLYEAKDGETFKVLEISNGWYKVTLKDGSIGWISEASVKSKTTENR